MDDVNTFRSKLRSARELRGWTHYGAAQRMVGVGHQQLMNLEGVEGATRETDPSDVTLLTAYEIIRVYWPDVGLEDFVGMGCLLRAAPVDSNASRKLKGYPSPG